MAGVVRIGINKTDLKCLAEAYKIPWSDWLLDRIIICENAIIKADSERLEASKQKGLHNGS